MAKNVFISYRREDTGPVAGRVYDRLRLILSDSHLFFDVSTISAGEDFEKRIIAALGKSEVVLVFIGEKWLEPMHDTGKPRIWQAADFVRIEVREALRRPILIIPILVGRADMPKPDQLPE